MSAPRGLNWIIPNEEKGEKLRKWCFIWVGCLFTSDCARAAHLFKMLTHSCLLAFTKIHLPHHLSRLETRAKECISKERIMDITPRFVMKVKENILLWGCGGFSYALTKIRADATRKETSFT